jgi:hypothetical protein
VLKRSDIKAYLYVLNYQPIMYWLPGLATAHVDGSPARLTEQLEGLVRKRPRRRYWRELLEAIGERERLGGIPDPDEITSAALSALTRTLALRLYSLYTQSGECYRKVLLLDGKRYLLSPVTAEEFGLFHGGHIEAFKKDFGYKELSDFSPEELARAEVVVYDGHGMKLSWSDWNKCFDFGEEYETQMREEWGAGDEDEMVD